MDLGSEIRDPEKTYSGPRILVSKRHRIPDPDPGSGSRIRIRNTGLRNRDSPSPSPAGECAPYPSVPGGGAHSQAREGLGESQFRLGNIHCGTLYIYVLCAPLLPTSVADPSNFGTDPDADLDPRIHTSQVRKSRNQRRGFLLFLLDD
jgi:hypothetical protein